MAGRKPYDFSTPWSFARAWALYIVYIPTTRYQGELPISIFSQAFLIWYRLAALRYWWFQRRVITQPISEISQ